MQLVSVSLLHITIFFLETFFISYLELGKEYQENRAEFNRKATECVRQHGLPR